MQGIVAIVGAPGVGKNTIIDKMYRLLTENGYNVVESTKYKVKDSRESHDEAGMRGELVSIISKEQLCSLDHEGNIAFYYDHRMYKYAEDLRPLIAANNQGAMVFMALNSHGLYELLTLNHTKHIGSVRSVLLYDPNPREAAERFSERYGAKATDLGLTGMTKKRYIRNMVKTRMEQFKNESLSYADVERYDMAFCNPNGQSDGFYSGIEHIANRLIQGLKLNITRDMHTKYVYQAAHNILGIEQDDLQKLPAKSIRINKERILQTALDHKISLSPDHIPDTAIGRTDRYGVLLLLLNKPREYNDASKKSLIRVLAKLNGRPQSISKEVAYGNTSSFALSYCEKAKLDDLVSFGFRDHASPREYYGLLDSFAISIADTCFSAPVALRNIYPTAGNFNRLERYLKRDGLPRRALVLQADSRLSGID